MLKPPIEVWTESDKSIRIFHGDNHGHGPHDRLRIQIKKETLDAVIELSYSEVDALTEAFTKWYNEECCNA